MAREPKPQLPPRAGPSTPVSDLVQAALASFVAEDPVSVRVLEHLHRIAATDSTVLIQGESGTGKDVVASLLHYLGRTPGEPMVKIDCASLPHELVESELFGYERGAFTGASQSKRGRMELAESGTLVLDEVAALAPAIQAKLLRALEERTFLRLGGTKPVRVNARLVAMTSADLEGLVKHGAFREDLFYRLNVVPLRLRPLRERPRDIRPLVQHFMKRLGANLGRPALKLGSAALALLEEYTFPGNVRELRNLLERAAVQAASDTIAAADLPDAVRRPGAAAERKSLMELERDHIAEVLDHTRGKKSKAAAILGISRKNLLEKRKRYKLD
ncbi:MAG: sigma-54-dependent Fis family transcriptional regulator [Acidobacteriales bacterium]|nr:sigma-54-dependent Fis family transcriptional regulator [Terriglobales bacterium]